MTLTFTGLYTGTHQYKDGTVDIAVPFVGNVLAIELTTKPEYVESNQIIGYLFQAKDDAQKAYVLRSGKDVIKLDLPETDRLLFSPTRYLTDTYTLTIGYATVGNVGSGSINLTIPEQILGLPARVEALEGTEWLVDWDMVTGKPTSFIPSIHTHEISDVSGLTTALNQKANSTHLHSISDVSGLTEALNGKANLTHTHSISDIVGLSVELGDIGNDLVDLETRITNLEEAVPVSSGSSQNFLSIGANQVLESNKNYFANTSELVCSLPSNPSIGDVINLSTGNYPFRVNHGNASQFILNSSTNTTTGIDSGIILKPYATIQLIYQGANLWVSTYRVRTINNWLAATVESSSSQKSYTPSALGNYTFLTNWELNKINNGLSGGGNAVYKSGGDAGALRVLCTLSAPIYLDSISTLNMNASSAPTNNMKVYRGSTVDASKLILDGTLTYASGSSGSDNFTINDTEASNTFVLVLSNGANDPVIGEVSLFGRAISGGEIVVS